jgi:hypothetical protein
MTSRIAFFGVPSYPSGEIRGRQIADKLNVSSELYNASYNEAIDVASLPDHVVFIKSFPAEEIDFLLSKGVTIWIDPVDADNCLVECAKRPELKILAAGESARDYIEARVSNDVTLIPQQHCNFENHQRTNWPPKFVGYVGYLENLDVSPGRLEKVLRTVQLEFIAGVMDEKATRKQVAEFYQKLDIQITFRGPRLVKNMPPEMKNPLKVYNAASYGIPTVGFPEPSYKEFMPLYPVRSFEDLIVQCERLKEQTPFFRTDLLERSEEYSLDNVVKLYEKAFLTC